MDIAKHLQNVAKEQALLTAKTAVLKSLPQNLDVEHLFYLNARWHLYLNGDVQVALAALPPSNARMTLDNGTWVAEPEDRPLDWNQRVLPVSANQSGVNWFAKLTMGEIIEVTVKDASLPIPPGYSLSASVHSTVAVREVQSMPLAISPVGDWEQAWQGFFEAEGYTAAQRYSTQMLQALSKKGREVTVATLPAPSIGDAFTQEQLDRLLAFANAQRCDLEKRQGAAAKDGIAKARTAIAEFQTLYLDGGVANSPVDEVLTQWVQEKTGYPVSVSIRSPLIGYRTPGVYELYIHLWRFNEIAVIKMPAVYNKAGFDFQNPSFYQFVPNNQRFSKEEAVPA